LSAHQSNGSYDELNSFLCQKVNKSIRKFTFPEEYNYHGSYNNYYSLTEVEQTENSLLIGLSIIIYVKNDDYYKKGYDDIEQQSLVKQQFKTLHKGILRNIRLNN